MSSPAIHKSLKPALFVVALIPLAYLVFRAVNNHLGANPIETINRYTGDWVLRFLMLTLAVTPLRKLTGWNALLRYRRMLGLFAFFYVCLHFLSWVWLDQFFVLAASGINIRKLAKPTVIYGRLITSLMISASTKYWSSQTQDRKCRQT